MRAINSFIGISLFMLLCGACSHTASQADIRQFCVDIDKADRVELAFGSANDDPQVIAGEQLDGIVKSFTPSNMIGWPDDIKIESIGQIIFYKSDSVLLKIQYLDGSVCKRDGVYIKLVSDPIRPLVSIK